LGGGIEYWALRHLHRRAGYRLATASVDAVVNDGLVRREPPHGQLRRVHRRAVSPRGGNWASSPTKAR
jgi:hypothetical protein